MNEFEGAASGGGGGVVPECTLPYALWCVVNNVGISLIKIDKLRMLDSGARVGDCPCRPLPRRARVYEIFFMF